MTDGQYRALIAWMQYWPFRASLYDLDYAIRDIGITDGREAVLMELFKAGWRYEEPTGRLRYQG